MDKQTIIDRVNIAHGNAVDKGWWQEERSLGELVALMHSEASEALEEFRNGHEPTDVWYEKKDASTGQIKTMALQPFDDWKPCGIPSELADIVIRVYDLVGAEEKNEELADVLIEHMHEGRYTSMNKDAAFGDNMGWLHVNISKIIIGRKRITELARVVHSTYKIAEFNGIELDVAIAEKMSYNATRPIRHGGKKL